MKPIHKIIGVFVFCMPFVVFGQIHEIEPTAFIRDTVYVFSTNLPLLGKKDTLLHKHFDKIWVKSGSVSFDGGIHLRSKEQFIPSDLMEIDDVQVDTSQGAIGGTFYKEVYVQVKKPTKEGFYIEQGGFAGDTFICYVRLIKNVTVYSKEKP